MKKKRKTKIQIFSLVLGAVLCISTFVGCSKKKPEQAGITLSPAISQGATLYDFDEIQNQKVTLRQPKMEVLERGLSRTAPEVMSDTFVLPSNFTTGELSTAEYTFDPASYPGQFGTCTKIMTTFEKYMLLRQTMYYNTASQGLAEKGLLKKHPAADRQYGEIPVEDNAVKKRIVTDPEYKASMLTTGLYLPAGEIATVKVKGLKAGERLEMVTGYQQSIAWATDFNTYDRLIIEESKKANPDYESLGVDIHNHMKSANSEIAYQIGKFTFTENDREYKIGYIFGGQLHIDCSRVSGPVEIEITGCIETPHFILGVTSVEEFEEHLRNAPGLLCTLDVEIGQLVGPAAAMQQTDDILKVAYMWHSTFAINVSLLGRSYNYTNLLKYDTFVPAGAAVALSGRDSAMPASDMFNCLNFANLKLRGEWMTLHELGHQHANQGAFGKVFGMDTGPEGEVRNNVMILYNYALTCNINTNQTSDVEHGEFTHPYNAVLTAKNAKNATFTDYGQAGGSPFWCLGLYANMIHQFGPEKFTEYLYSHALVKNYNDEGYGNNRSEFVIRLSEVYGLDFRNFLNEYYKANITDSLFSPSRLEKLSKLKEFIPIACKFSNGTSDFRSAGAHKVSAATPTVFEFENNIVSTKDFQLVSVTKPKYGRLQKETDTKYTYYPPNKLTNGDEFFVVCKLANGETVKLAVRLEFNYNSSYSQIWEGITATNLQEAIDNCQLDEPTRDEYSNVAGKSSFNGGRRKDYVKSTFNFVATKDGVYKFYLKSDDIGRVDASKDGETYTIKTTAYTANYQADNYFELTLSKNDVVPFTTHLYNAGGQGSLNVGVMKPDTTNIINIPDTEIIMPNLDFEDYQKIKTFGWQPKFLASVKNFTKVTYINKTDWEILEAPKAYNNTNPNVLVDGDINSLFHSEYTNASLVSAMPHVYVLDMKNVNKINFFEIYTRNHANSYIIEYELYGSKDGKKYNLLAKADELNYTNRKATIKFDTVSVRYLKLLVKKTTFSKFDGYVSIMTELNAGLSAVAEYVISPASETNFYTQGFKEEGNNGILVSNKKNSALVTKFKGTQFNIYADTFENAGRFNVYVDGKLDATVNLSGQEKSSELVYSSSKLKNKKHTVEIKTLDNKGVEIKYMSINYGASMLNAANIYKERALGIALAIFCVLFVFAVTLLVLYFTLPKFREFVNKLFRLEKQTSPETLAKKAKKKQERKEKKAEIKTEKQKAKSEASSTTVKTVSPKQTPSVAKTKATSAKKVEVKKPATKTVSQTTQKKTPPKK